LNSGCVDLILTHSRRRSKCERIALRFEMVLGNAV